jgi:hypothetical protein
VQDSLGEAGLCGERSTGQRVRAITQQDTLGSVEQLLAEVADRYSRWHWYGGLGG